MHVPSPNEQDYLVWAAERTDAGDIDLSDDYDGGWLIEVAPWTVQRVLDGVMLYGEDSDLEYEDLVIQFRSRAGVEARPWTVDDVPEEEPLAEIDLDDLRDFDDEDEYGYEEDEVRPTSQVCLPIREPYRPGMCRRGDPHRRSRVRRVGRLGLGGLRGRRAPRGGRARILLRALLRDRLAARAPHG